MAEAISIKDGFKLGLGFSLAHLVIAIPLGLMALLLVPQLTKAAVTAPCPQCGTGIRLRLPLPREVHCPSCMAVLEPVIEH